MATNKKNQPPSQAKYVQLKHGWVKDQNKFIVLQRNFFVLLSIASIFGVMIAMIVIKSMVEKNAIEPYVISVNTADKMPISVSSQSVKNYTEANQAVIEFFLVKYVRSREGYNFGTYTYDYDIVTRMMSSDMVYRRFKKENFSNDDTNPIKVFKNFGRVEVVIKQITHGVKSRIAIIRIAKKVYKHERLDSVLNFQIKLHYDIKTENLKASDIEINPLGITIDTYEVTEEKTLIEDETVFR